LLKGWLEFRNELYYRYIPVFHHLVGAFTHRAI
jgi:hypothetical protein